MSFPMKIHERTMGYTKLLYYLPAVFPILTINAHLMKQKFYAAAEKISLYHLSQTLQSERSSRKTNPAFPRAF